jgi:hypothetical protein
MGLKTTNYEVKKLGITLPEAYAIVKDLEVHGTSGYAIIAVQSSRENADKVVKGQMQALEEKRVDFVVNRDANDRATAYEAAKKEKTTRRMNRETRKMEEVVIDEMFKDWEDDIV